MLRTLDYGRGLRLRRGVTLRGTGVSTSAYVALALSALSARRYSFALRVTWTVLLYVLLAMVCTTRLSTWLMGSGMCNVGPCLNGLVAMALLVMSASDVLLHMGPRLLLALNTSVSVALEWSMCPVPYRVSGRSTCCIYL